MRGEGASAGTAPAAGPGEGEARFRAAFEHAPIGMGLVAPDGRWLDANRALCELVGYGREELLGATVQELTHPDDAAAELEQSRRLFAGEIASYQIEKRCLHRSGRPIWILLTASCVPDASGAPLYAIAHVIDLTARKAEERRGRQLAREREARAKAEAAAERTAFLARASSTLASSLDHEATLSALAALVVPELGDYCLVDIRDVDGTIRRLAACHADPARQALVEALLEYPPDPARPEHMIVRAMDTGEPVIERMGEAAIARIARGPEHARILRALRGRWAMAVPLVARGRTLGALTVVLAGRTRRRYGATARALAEEVARRAAVAVDNARLYGEAQAASRAKSEFLAVVSHELRTPLNGIVGYTDLLEAQVVGPLVEQQKLYLDRIRRGIAHLLGLIDEILTYSRLEAGRETVRREPLDAAELARQATALIEPTAAERGLGFVLDCPAGPLPLDTDPRKLRQILFNLLSNAVKFTERGEVRLSVRRRGGAVHFVVADTGIGIASEHHERIFEPFWQVEQGTTRSAGGTGLGLSVTRELARLMGGDVVVQSTPGRGSTFTVRLPSLPP